MFRRGGADLRPASFVPMNKPLHDLVRCMLGALFCLSALLKFRSVDSFELYLFSFGALPFDLCSLAARLLICAEWWLGAAFLTGWWHRSLRWLYALSLGGFSIWLAGLLIAGEEGNCHCFGDAVELDAAASLVKNALLGALLLFVWRMPDRSSPPRPVWPIAFGLVCLVCLFAASPPDRYLRARRQSSELIPELYAPVADSLCLDRGRRMICLYSPTCRYCRLTARKVAALCRRHHLNPDRTFSLFLRVNGEMPQTVAQFYAGNGGMTAPYAVLPPRTLLDLCNGALPLVLLTDGGRVVAEYDYRTLDEEAVARFFED